MNNFVFTLYKIAGGAFTPPGCFFVLLFILLLIMMLKTKERITKRISIITILLVSLMYVLFMPVTAEFLMGCLETNRPTLPDDNVPTLVAVLAGGGTHPVPSAGSDKSVELSEQSYQRLSEGVIIAKSRNWPLLYSGAYDEGDAVQYAESIRSQAKLWGLDSEVIMETASRTTWENLKEIASFVEKEGYKRIVISTTAYHMKRSIWMAEQQIPGVEIVPWPSGWRSTRDKLALNSFGYSARAFLDSCTALREIVGLAAYQLRFIFSN